MKGRDIFSREEAAQIKDLLDKKIKSGNQKSLRDKLRKIGFYSDDFKRIASGFTPEDFDDLVRTKRISVSENTELRKIDSKFYARPNENHVQGFQPIVSEQAQSLILGTVPGGKSLLLKEYYADTSNKFWQIIERVYGGRFSTYQARVDSLRSNRIALWDVLASCKRSGSLDKNIVEPLPNDFEKFFAAYPNIKQVFFNGQEAKRYYKTLVLPTLSSAPKRHLLVTLPSSSGAYARSLDFKVNAWAEKLENHV